MRVVQKVLLLSGFVVLLYSNVFRALHIDELLRLLPDDATPKDENGNDGSDMSVKDASEAYFSFDVSQKQKEIPTERILDTAAAAAAATTTVSPLSSLSCPTNKTKYRGTPLIRIPSNKAMLLHLGKAGGGSIVHRIFGIWGFPLKMVHPFPRPKKLGSNKAKDVFVVIGVRDPIDRFISAFHWRNVVLCNPNGDSREISRQATHDPDKYCKESDDPSESGILFGKYNESSNLLAEAMCDGQQGQHDVKHIRHASHSIQDWLTVDGAIFSSFERIIPLVVESGFDLDLQCDATVAFLQNNLNMENTTQFMTRTQQVKLKVCLEEEELAAEKSSRKGLSQILHSSVNHGKKADVISEKGLRCAYQYYAEDYVILKRLKDESCRTEECRGAIQSILDRRAILVGSNQEESI